MRMRDANVTPILGVQICNAVAVAKLLNATLIIPHFHLNSVWKDPRCVFSFFLNESFCLFEANEKVSLQSNTVLGVQL